MKRIAIYIFMIPLLVMASAAPAPAQECLPGLPCVVPMTPSDDYLQIDTDTPGNNAEGPNVGGTNVAKLDTATNPTGSRACDADFMNQITARAFLESEREVVMGNTILRKPDSVLEYTCFDQQAAVAYGPVAALFSDSEYFADMDVPINGGLGEIFTTAMDDIEIDVALGTEYHDTTIETLVLTALGGYIDTNFYHAFLGGAGIDNSGIGAGDGVCPVMFEVYYSAQCNNMDRNMSFLTFEELARLDDPRVYPRICPQKHGITAELVALAEQRLVNGAPAVQVDRADNNEAGEPLGSFLALMNRQLPASCASPPIPTGVTVILEEFESDINGNSQLIGREEFPDAICPNPSCTSIGGGTCF